MKHLLRALAFLGVASFVSYASAQTPTLYYVGNTTGDFATAANFSTSVTFSFFVQNGIVSAQVTGSGASRTPIPSDVLLVYADANDVNNGSTGLSPINLTQDVPGQVLTGFQATDLTNIFGGASTGTINLTNTQTFTITGRTGDTGTTNGLVPYGDFVVDGGVVLNYSGGGPQLLVNRGLTVVGDNATVTDGVAFTGGNSPGSGTLNIASGTMSFDPITGPAGSTTQIDIAEGAGAVGTVTQGAPAVPSVAATSTTPFIPAIPATASTVTLGNTLYIGYGGGNGTWNVTNGSTLQTTTDVAHPVIALGVNLQVTNTTGTPTVPITGGGSQGTLTISDSSIFNLNTGADLQLGTLTGTATTGGAGIITQNGSSSVVNFKGTSTVELGDAATGSGNYNLQSGTLNIGTNAGDTVVFSVGAAASGIGTVTQTGGTLTAGSGSTIVIGNLGSGTYNLVTGSADFKNGFTMASQGGSSGTVLQTGGTLSAEAPVFVGTAAAGLGAATYTLQGGTATFSNTLTVGNGDNLSLNGGTLKIAAANLLNAGTGNLNFGGGTLQFTSGTTFTDPFTTHTLAANTTSTIDASVPGTFTSVTLGGLTGGGGITLKGTDGTTIFHFTPGVNTYTGATTITSGTLSAGSADIINSSALNIGPADTLAKLNLTVAATGLPYAGALNGTGILNVIFSATGNAGAFIVANTSSNFTGPITLGGTGGTLQVYGGTFGNIGQTATSGLVIGGAPLNGALTVPSTGTVTLGTNTYTGPTTINSGFTLNVANLTSHGLVTNSGTLNTAGIGGSINNTGGVLNPTGTLGTGTTITVGANPAVIIGGTTLAVGGNLTSSGAGNTLSARIAGTTADLIQVSGTATLTNTFISLINPSGTGSYAILKTAAAGNLNATGLTTITPSALFSATLDASSNQYLIVNTIQNTLSSFATTPNELAVANTLNPLTQTPPPAFAPILSALNQVPVSLGNVLLPQDLEELSPEDLQYARFISIENSTFLVQRMNGILGDLRSTPVSLDTSGIGVIAPGFESSLGRSLGSLLAYSPFHSSAPNGVNYYPGGDDSAPSSYPSSDPLSPSHSSSPTSDSSGETISDSPIQLRTSSEAPALRTPRLEGFVAGDVALANLNQNQNTSNAPSSKASYTAGDALAGVGFRVTAHLITGAFFDYNHTDANTDNRGSKTKVDTYSPGIFATYSDHGFYVNGLFAFGLNNYSNSRNIAFLGSTASSSPTGQQYVTNLDLGYDFHPDSAWTLGPTFGLTYTHLDIDSFSETGAGGADLNVNSQNIDSLRSRLGGHLVYQTHSGNVLFQPNITAMWQHEYLDNNNAITSQFNIPGSGSFTIQSASNSKNSALVGCGITATLDNSMSLYLNYLADVGADDYFAQTVIGGFKANF